MRIMLAAALGAAALTACQGANCADQAEAAPFTVAPDDLMAEAAEVAAIDDLRMRMSGQTLVERARTVRTGSNPATFRSEIEMTSPEEGPTIFEVEVVRQPDGIMRVTRIARTF